MVHSPVNINSGIQLQVSNGFQGYGRNPFASIEIITIEDLQHFLPAGSISKWLLSAPSKVLN
jgi:hypothetical protein